MDHNIKSKPVVSGAIKPERIEEIEQVTDRIFGARPTRVAIPGGKSRPVYIIEIEGRPYVVAKRSNKYDAKVEAAVLKGLTTSDLVPGFIGKHGRWIAQEFIPGKRLPVLIDEAKNEVERKTLAELGIKSLLAIQHAADAARLRRSVPRLGVVKGWVEGRIHKVDEISEALAINPPSLNRTAIAQIYDVSQTDFVKWDARPGNALVDGPNVRWFDWEDCGRRNRIDDLVCFMADEWTNLDADTEDALIKDYLPSFSRALGAEWSERYFYVAGCLQILYRLSLATNYYHRDGEWWDRKYCLDGDKVGVTAQEVGRLTRRLERWSQRVEIMLPFCSWAQQVRSELNIK
ncbi:MAG: hypothetical protein ACSHX3_08680 [Litorimonas sp.]